MNYEIAVLAALVQLEKPTGPRIIEATGISAQRVNTAINRLKDLLDLGIEWHGAKKTGHYDIGFWGAFETGKSIRRKAYSLDLKVYKLHHTIFIHRRVNGTSAGRLLAAAVFFNMPAAVSIAFRRTISAVA